MTPLDVWDALAALLLAAWVSMSEDARQARARAAAGMALLTVLTAVAGVRDLLAGVVGAELFWGALAPLAICLIGWVAVALNPLEGRGPATWVRILALLAASLAFHALASAAGLAALWCATALIAWWEIRGDEGEARVFAAYQVPSALLVVTGAALTGAGMQVPGALAAAAGIAIRQGLLPVQSWFPRFAERSPMGVVVAFACPQLALYGHAHLVAAGLTPPWAHGLAVLGAATAVLAAALGTVQSEGRRALAFLMLSQSGLIAFALESESAVAHAGVLLLWLVVGISTAGLAMTMAALEARRGELGLAIPAGSFARTPRMAVAFLLLGFASVGLPATLGFVAEDLILQGSMGDLPQLALALIVATALNGVTVMRSFFQLFHGAREGQGEVDLTPRESVALTVGLAVLLVTGAVPGYLVRAVAEAPAAAHGQAQNH